MRVALFASTSKTHASASVGMKFKHILRGAFTDCAPAVALFAALLFERRVVISGSDTGAVAGAVHAAAASIAPFKWHHIFLPILPHQFLEYLTAPMPFLVGVHASCLPFIKKLPTEEVFHLNLDSGEYTYFESDLDALPGRPRRALELKLQQQLEQPRLDDERVCHAFRVFLSTGTALVLSQIRRHTVLPLTLATVRTDYVTVVHTSSNTRPTNGLTLFFTITGCGWTVIRFSQTRGRGGQRCSSRG